MGPSSDVLDAHFHTWEQSFPARAYPWTPDPCGVDHVLEVFDMHGVGGGIDVTPIMYGFDNTETLAACGRSGGRLTVFGRLDPATPEPRQRLLEWLARPSAAGVRLTFYGDDRSLLSDPATLDPFWTAAEALGVRVAVFAPDELWKLVGVMEAHPQLRLVIDHLGLGVYPGCDDPYRHHSALDQFVPFEQVLIKISGAIEVSRDPGRFADTRDLIDAARERFGAHRLMWGSNYPVVLATCTYGEALAFVETCEFTSSERQQVLAGTCRQMLAEAEPTTKADRAETSTRPASSNPEDPR